MHIRRRLIAFIALVLVASTFDACSARGPRNRTRVASLAVGETALALDQTERQLYLAEAYDKAAHDRIGVVVLKVLYASRAFERAAAEWPEDGSPAPATVTAARTAVLAALADVEKVLPAAAAAREPILRALAAIRAALEAQS